MNVESERRVERSGRLRLHEAVLNKVRTKAASDREHLIEFFSRRASLTLPSLGCDSAILGSIAFYSYKREPNKAFSNGLEASTLADYDLALTAITLYEDGSPYVPEGFNLDVETPADFYIATGGEVLPFIVQATVFEFTDEAWTTCGRRSLADQDCEAFLSFLKVA